MSTIKTYAGDSLNYILLENKVNENQEHNDNRCSRHHSESFDLNMDIDYYIPISELFIGI